MGRKKSRPVTCKGCGFLHDLNLDGWADMKIAREIYGKHDEDNVLDLVNYAYLYADLAQETASDAQIIDTLSRIKKGD